MKETEIKFKLSSIESLNLKRFLGSRGIINKDLSTSLLIYIKKNMQEEEKKVEVKKPITITIENGESDKYHDYTFDISKIIAVKNNYWENPDTVDFIVTYLDENNIVKNQEFDYDFDSKTSHKQEEKLCIAITKNCKTIRFHTWEHPNTHEYSEYIFVKDHIRDVKVMKKSKKIYIYSKQGYLHTIEFLADKRNKLLNLAIEKLKEYINEQE